jgi:hypothetical protein
VEGGLGRPYEKMQVGVGAVIRFPTIEKIRFENLWRVR